VISQSGDYVISYSHLQAGKAIRDVPSGYLAFLVDELDAGRLNPSLKVSLQDYMENDPDAAEKLERGRKVPTRVVVKGFSSKAQIH